MKVIEQEEEKNEFRYNEFEKELARLINAKSLENGSNTPDFILAHFLTSSLKTFNSNVNMRDEWKCFDKYKKMLLLVIEDLWQLLDDIDTMSDSAKENDEKYRQGVNKILKKRFDIPIYNNNGEITSYIALGDFSEEFLNREPKAQL